ncbi:unnamed protein product [Dicrocoelium dendriticum]|nr:unnamed protein product [Dicrocoelium dendriticum]
MSLDCVTNKSLSINHFQTPFNYGLPNSFQSAFWNRPNQCFTPASPTALESDSVRSDPGAFWRSSLSIDNSLNAGGLVSISPTYESSRGTTYVGETSFRTPTRVGADHCGHLLPVQHKSSFGGESGLVDKLHNSAHETEFNDAAELPNDYSLQNKLDSTLLEISPESLVQSRKRNMSEDVRELYSGQFLGKMGSCSDQSSAFSAVNYHEIGGTLKLPWNNTVYNTSQRSPNKRIHSVDAHSDTMVTDQHTNGRHYPEVMSSPGSSSPSSHQAPHIAAAAACVAAAAAAVAVASTVPVVVSSSRPTTVYPLLMNTPLAHHRPYGPGPLPSNPYPFLPQATARPPYDSLRHFTHPNFHHHSSHCFGYGLDGTRRKNATRESTTTLKVWLQEHIKNPYPTKGEKIMLAIITKMTLTQVSTWFANARRRLKKENKMCWPPKTCSSAARSASENPHSNSNPGEGGKMKHAELSKKYAIEENVHSEGEDLTELDTDISEDADENVDELDGEEEDIACTDGEMQDPCPESPSTLVPYKKTSLRYLEVTHPGYDHAHIDAGQLPHQILTESPQMTKFREQPVSLSKNGNDILGNLSRPYQSATSFHASNQRSLMSFPFPMATGTLESSHLPLYPSSLTSLHRSPTEDAIDFLSSGLSVSGPTGLHSERFPFTTSADSDVTGSPFLRSNFLPRPIAPGLTGDIYGGSIRQPKHFPAPSHTIDFPVNIVTPSGPYLNANPRVPHPNLYDPLGYAGENKHT